MTLHVSCNQNGLLNLPTHLSTAQQCVGTGGTNSWHGGQTPNNGDGMFRTGRRRKTDALIITTCYDKAMTGCSTYTTATSSAYNHSTQVVNVVNLESLAHISSN